MLGTELADCWLKIGRAEEHAKTASDEITAWESSKIKPYTITKNRDAEGHRYSFNVNFSNSPDRDRWSLIAGDCVHNLRSSLDHLIYAVAVSQSGSNPPPDERRLQFPIADDANSFAIQKPRIQSLSKTVRASIEGIQPFNRPDRLLPPLLSIIRDFDDRDKHRLLNVAVHRQQTGHVQIDAPVGYVVGALEWSTGDVVDGAEVVAFTVEPPCLEVKYQYETAFTIGVGHAPGPTGVEVTGIRRLLSLLCEEVRTVVEIVGQKA